MKCIESIVFLRVSTPIPPFSNSHRNLLVPSLDSWRSSNRGLRIGASFSNKEIRLAGRFAASDQDDTGCAHSQSNTCLALYRSNPSNLRNVWILRLASAGARSRKFIGEEPYQS